MVGLINLWKQLKLINEFEGAQGRQSNMEQRNKLKIGSLSEETRPQSFWALALHCLAMGTCTNWKQFFVSKQASNKSNVSLQDKLTLLASDQNKKIRKNGKVTEHKLHTLANENTLKRKKTHPPSSKLASKLKGKRKRTRKVVWAHTQSQVKT